MPILGSTSKVTDLVSLGEDLDVCLFMFCT